MNVLVDDQTVVQRLLARARGPELEAERRTVTVMFADIRGFTSLAERLSPEELHGILNAYFRVMIDAIAALPGPIAREAVLTRLRGVTTYDAGGFLGPIQLGPKLNNGCAIAMIVEGGAWRRVTPDSGFLC